MIPRIPVALDHQGVYHPSDVAQEPMKGGSQMARGMVLPPSEAPAAFGRTFLQNMAEHGCEESKHSSDLVAKADTSLQHMFLELIPG